MDIDKIAAEVNSKLRDAADPVRAENEQRYFKETIRSHGVTVPGSRAIGKEIYRRERENAVVEEWLALGERLLATGWLEQGTVGLQCVELARPPASEELFDTYERWMGAHVGNWAHCDFLSTDLLSRLLIELPDLVARLSGWTASDNRWVRRGAAVSLVIPARKGLFLDEALAIAEALLDDDDDLVQKGFGWMLREAAKEHQAAVTGFLEREVGRMPRTAFRYAIEKFPKDERKRLMSL